MYGRAKIVQDCRCITHKCVSLCGIHSESWINTSIVALGILQHCLLYYFPSVAFVTQYIYVDDPRKQNLSFTLWYSLYVIAIIIGQAQVADLFEFGCCHQAFLFSMCALAFLDATAFYTDFTVEKPCV